MITKNIIYGLTFGGLAWYVYDAYTSQATIDTIDNQAGGVASVLDGFMSVGYSIGSGAGMQISLNGLYFIKQNEGFKANVYLDSAGYKTIGYGHKLTLLENYKTITEQTAAQLLARDVTTAEDAINSLVKVNIKQAQFDALCSFVYNVGAGAFSRSTMLKMINTGDFSGAASQFASWSKITINGQKVTSSGILSRRQREAQLFTA